MNNKQLLIIFSLLLTGNYASFAQTQKAKDKGSKNDFSNCRTLETETDVRADATMVYGTLDKKGVSFEQRVQSWRDKGYQTQL